MTSSLIDRYFGSLAERLETVRTTQAAAIEAAMMQTWPRSRRVDRPGRGGYNQA